MDNLVFITIFLFLLFSSHIIFYKFFVILSHSFLKSGYSLSLFLFIFLFFLATLLYIDESLWFLKLYFGFICFVVVFFSSPLQVVSLSLSLSHSFDLIFVWVNTWLFWKWEFEFISKCNLGYADNRSTFGPFRSTSSIRFDSVYFSSFQSILVQFVLLRSTSVQLSPFGLLWSIQSNLVYLVLFGPFSPIRSILLWSIWSCSVHSVYFAPIWSRSLRSIWSIRST